MKNRTVGIKIGFAALLGLITTVTLSVAAYCCIKDLQAVIDSAYDFDAKKIEYAGYVRAEIREMLAKEEALVSDSLQHNAAEFANDSKEYDESALAAHKDLSNLAKVVETAEERAQLASLSEWVEKWSPLHAELLRYLKAGDIKNGVDYQNDHLDSFTDSADQAAANFIKVVNRSNQDSNDESDREVSHSFTLILSLGFVGMFVAGLSLWIGRTISNSLRRLITELSSGSDQVASASRQIASTSQGLSQGASEQAASLEEISASMEEMTAMARRNTENSGQASGVMTETSALVSRSNTVLGEMLVSMNAMQDSSQRIAKIIKTIDEIAFQTNILALNAAVEAARAGEAGMGFAVVADEVRNLAQRAALAAKDTTALIEEGISNSKLGSTKLDEVATAVAAITESAQKVTTLVQEVSESSKQQTIGINQASSAITQVSKVTQTAAASAEESAAASQELSSQSQVMQDLVLTLTVMVDGDGKGRASLSTGTTLCP
jgi:methyl-accepting chemotaxis protein